MRAKMTLASVKSYGGDQEELEFHAVQGSKVAAEGYPEGGEDEDNTFARFSPSGQLTLTVANPDLVGTFKPGTKYYVDFAAAD